MRNSSKWVHKQAKRAQAVAYGCYPDDSDPNPLNLDRDGEEVEKAARLEDRKAARQVISGIRASTKGAALVGPWEPKG